VNFKPANGFLLLQPCDEPFEKGPLEVVRDEMLIRYGMVIAFDGDGKPYQDEGSIVFYLDSSSLKIVLDREEVYTLLHEGQVMGYIPAAMTETVKTQVVRVQPRAAKKKDSPIEIAPAAALAALES
jgi:hypothetical protein